MAIAVTNIGTGAAIALGVSAAVGAGGVPAGTLIVVCVQDTTVGAATGSVADTAGNTYTLITSKSPNNSTTNGAAQMFYAWNSLALSSGDSITYTGTDATRSKSISAAYATGIQASSDPLIAASVNTATGTSQTLSVTSGSPGVAGALFVAFVGRNNPTSATFTQDTADGWSNPPNDAHEGSGSPHSAVNCGSQVNAANSTLTFAPGWNTTCNQAQLIAAFTPSSGGTTTVTLAQASWSWTGNAANVNAKSMLALAQATWAWTGNAAGIDARSDLTLAQALWPWTGFPANVAGNAAVTLAQAAWDWIGNAAAVNAKAAVTLAQAAWTWTAAAPEIATVVTLRKAAWQWVGRPLATGQIILGRLMALLGVGQ